MIKMTQKQPALFLDRDGVINANVFYHDTQCWESPRSRDAFRFIPGALYALKAFQKAQYLLFIISNQPSYAKGKTSLENLRAIHATMMETLAKENISLCEAYYCYHHPEAVVSELKTQCKCRKPSPYFLLEARDRYALDFSRSWMIGDRDTDLACAESAGVRPIGIRPDHPPGSGHQRTAVSPYGSLRELISVDGKPLF